MLMTANMSIIVHRPPLIGAWIIVRWIGSYRAHTWPFSYPDERLVAKFQRNFTSCNSYIPRNKRKKWESERKKIRYNQVFRANTWHLQAEQPTRAPCHVTFWLRNSSLGISFFIYFLGRFACLTHGLFFENTPWQFFLLSFFLFYLFIFSFF